MSERLRILLVDDDPAERLAIRRAIEHGGLVAHLDEIGTADEALARVSQQRYDCLLVDLDLGHSSGIELSHRIRAADDLTPVVLLTGQHDEELLKAAIDAGVTDFFLRTDLSPRRLALRIQVAIRIGHAEAASTRLLAQATQAARARDDVLAIVSHDLRGPLHAISLACEALHDEATGTALRYLGAIERASHRAERLISDLLEANLIENGALALARHPVDAAAIVKQAAADHELLARESGGKITATVPDEATQVSADRDRVLQVLGNLIGNALKHARGSAIEIVLKKEAAEAVIAVRDKGPGITESELPHLFDRYWRGRTRKGGAGLGLSIAKGIVDAHGGKLQVASRPGEGAEFSFRLPLA